MKLIIGLGNPGKEYENTRHNAGFILLDYIQEKLGFENFHEEKKFKALVSIGELNGEKAILAKPLTFMNLSGEAVQKIMQFYKIPLSDIIIVYDDVDLPLGTIRIRKNGSPGTHNGMKSIVQAIGDNFPRIRIGIESRGETAPEKQETVSFVLEQFKKEEQLVLEKELKKVLEAIKMIFTEGLEKAMNTYNPVTNKALEP